MVVGLGIVGLTTAVSFAEAGFPTTGYDINRQLVASLKKGKTGYYEPGMARRLSKALSKGALNVTHNGTKALASGEAIVVCVATPLKNKKPNLRYLDSSIRQIGTSLQAGVLVCVTSTVPPLTTVKLVKPTLEKLSGLVCGEDFWLSYCPERVIPGNALEEFSSNTKVIGGYDSGAVVLSRTLFSSVTQGQLCLTDCTTAETVKLAENTVRDVEIAFANQLAIICGKVGVNVWEAIDFANTHPRVKILGPGPGVGGACLPKDPYMLTSPYSHPIISSALISAARAVNDSMPERVVRFVLRKTGGKAAAGKRTVAVLGTAYKGNTGDTRNSPSKPIIRKFLAIFKRVLSYDPYTLETFGSDRGRDLRSTVQESSSVVILADHNQFRAFDFRDVKKGKIVFDFRNLVNRERVETAGHQYFGLASL